MDDEEIDTDENELDESEEQQDSTEEQGPNPENAKDEVKKNIDRAKKTKEAMQKAQKAKKTAETAKKVKAAAKFASGAKKFALLANPYFWIALLIILAIIVLIGLIMSFTIMPSNFLGRCKKFVEGMMQGFCGFIWGDSTSPISNSSDDVKDLANYIQNMGYDIQGYGFGDVEYTNDTEKQRKEVQETNEAANAIDGKKNYVTEEQATQGGEIKKVYGLTAVTTVSSDQYKDGSEMFRITGRFSSKNNDYLRAYLSAEAATYTEATYSIKGFFNELGSSIIKGLSDIFGGNSSDDWKDPGDVGVKSKSTGMLNFTNSGGNNIFNSTLGGSPTKIKVDPKNKKLILYEHSLSIFGISKIQWGQTFSVDLSNWTAIYGRPLELFLALHLSSMMPDLPYQIAVDQAFNTKVNINLEDVKIYFDTSVTLDGHRVTIGGDFDGAVSTLPGVGASDLPPNVQACYNLWHSKGLTDVQIAAILGNAYRECGGVSNWDWNAQKSALDAGEDLKLGNVNGLSCTLAGFLPGYGLELLQQYASVVGKDWGDATTQAEFVYYTLWGEYAAKCKEEKGEAAYQIILEDIRGSGTAYMTTAQWKNYSGQYPFESSFRDETNPSAAAWAYFICYEGMAGNEDQAHFCRECADYWYQRIQNSSASNGSDGTGTTGEGTKLGGTWRLTAYADNPQDQGQYVGQFAGSDVAGPGVPGKTIAIAQDVMAKYNLNFGDIIRIDGKDYILNDHGGGEMAGKDAIDIFTTEDHEYDEAYNHNTSDVYLVGHNGNSNGMSAESPSSSKSLSDYLPSANTVRKKKNYEALKEAIGKGDPVQVTLVDDDGETFTISLAQEDIKNLLKLIEAGTSGTNIKWPNIESVTNHWYYHIIDFYGTVDKNTPYGAYKKAKIAKKTINYKDEEGELDKYNIELTALLTSQNGIYYQVCEPYLNQRPSVYLRKIFHGVYYKYDGTTETARKISAARAIEAKYGTDNYNSDKFEKDPQKIVDKNITYNWHSTDSDSSKLSVTLEDATEYVNAKKAQVKIQKESDALISIDNQEIEGADGVSASAEEFLNAAQEVTTYIKQNDFHYGDAQHMPPMANGATNSDGSKYISCDRLVAWALYKIGFKDQPQNGLVVSQIYDYCTNKGWEKITNSSEVQAGDIVLTGSSETDLVHTFICAGQNKRYDCGSDQRIRLEGQYSGYTSQPFDEPISSNFVCAFRITGEVEPEETIDMSPEEAQQIIDKMGEDDGELEVNELGEESPMCKKLVDFKSNKSNSLEAFSLLENINSEAADVNYRLLKKLMIEMDYYSEDDMNSHEKNILLWVTNVEGTKGQDVADKINANLGQTSETIYKTLSDTGRDANEYGIQISNFMDNTTVVCPGDAKVKSTGEDEHGEFIELELLTLSDEKQYPENGHMMLLHQDDEKDKYYNIETKYEDEPIYSAVDVLKRYRFRDTYQVFEKDDVVGITMKISGLHNIKYHEGDSVLRGEIIADNPKNGVDEEDGEDGQKGDIIYVSMKKPDKTKIENVEDYIDPTYTYEDEKDMAEQLWYLDHPEYGNKYQATSNKKVSDYDSGYNIIKGANNEETIWFTLIGIYGYSPEGAAAIMGNWYCESGFEPNNAQNTYNSSSGLSDDQITAMIDSGEISKDSFVNTAYGYGLAQWTYWSRKEAMYDYMKGKGLSIADLGGQIGFANTEMKNLNCYGELTSQDKSRDDIYHLTEVYHDEYERSAGRNIDARAQAALEIYDRNKDKQIPEHNGGYNGSSDIEYVQWAIDNMANNDRVGYNTPNPNDWKYSDTGSWDVDCSSMVYYALKETRYSEWGGTCAMGTANEPDMLSAKGFVQHEFHSIDELEPGDILWTRGTGRDGQYHHHTEIYVADGKNVGAHSNYDGEYGDSSGKEVNVQSCATYWRYYFREGR